jgi:RNA polymerase sigma factor (sigma-70 family)
VYQLSGRRLCKSERAHGAKAGGVPASAHPVVVGVPGLFGSYSEGGIGMSGDPAVVHLVTRAREGDKGAWDELVERFAPLVWSICRRYRLSRTDSEDVSQGVWLRLVEHLADLREPNALPGWIGTTTQRECLRLLRVSRRDEPMDLLAGDRGIPDETGFGVEEEVLIHEQYAAARAALAQLPPRCQQLLAMLLQDPPPPYGEVSAALHMPIGSIGPNRGRCLDRLRKSPAFALLAGIDLEQTRKG